MKTTLFLLLAVSSLSPLMAQEDCGQYTSTNDIFQCSVRNLTEADQKLNDNYKQVLAKEDNVGKKKLKAAQNAWIKYRDLKCAYDADVMRGGTAEKLISVGCVLEETKNKSIELSQILNPEEGAQGKAKIYTVEKNETQVAQSQIYISGYAAEVLFNNLDIADRGAAGYVVREGKNTSCSGRNGEYECSISVDKKGEAISISNE